MLLPWQSGHSVPLFLGDAVSLATALWPWSPRIRLRVFRNTLSNPKNRPACRHGQGQARERPSSRHSHLTLLNNTKSCCLVGSKIYGVNAINRLIMLKHARRFLHCWEREDFTHLGLASRRSSEYAFYCINTQQSNSYTPSKSSKKKKPSIDKALSKHLQGSVRGLWQSLHCSWRSWSDKTVSRTQVLHRPPGFAD